MVEGEEETNHAKWRNNSPLTSFNTRLEREKGSSNSFSFEDEVDPTVSFEDANPKA